MIFYPDSAPVPDELRTDEMFLEPLSPAHVELDYAALMQSKAMLRRWSLSDWPSDDFTLADNRKDLERHSREHLERSAFTYTVLDPAATICLGCVYIQPLAPLFEGEDQRVAPDDGDYRGRIAFWVRHSRLANDLDHRLLHTLIDWFRNDWAFSRVVFSTSEQDERQIGLLTDLGLRHLYDKERMDGITGRIERYIVYG